MKFLCLHGMGTSGRIFEAQLSQICASLPGQHEFLYINGEVESQALPGVDAFFSGPYYCFYELPTPEELAAAYDLIWETLDEEGPFDGVIGFSQGGALASSFILNDVRSENPQNPFKCAIFFCASMPFDVGSQPFTVQANGTCCYADTGEQIKGFDVTQSIPETKSSGWSGTYTSSTRFLHRYTSPLSNLENAKISIPTVHIVGSEDDYYVQGCQLQDLCETENRFVVTHKGGHDIPKDRATTAKMVQCIQQMFHNVLVG